MSRVPKKIRNQLAELLKKLSVGPHWEPHIGPPATADEIKLRERAWRNSWIVPEMRQLLAWADGVVNVTEIQTYDGGYDYNDEDGVSKQ